MIVIFRNLRGLGKPAKRHLMTETIRVLRQTLCLGLTKLVAPSSCLTSVLGARRIDHWEYKDLVSGSGGILIGFNSSSYILIDKWVGEFSLSVVLMGRKDSFIQAITSVYGLNRRNLRLFSSKGFFILNKDGLYPGLLEGISMLSVSLTNEKEGKVTTTIDKTSIL